MIKDGQLLNFGGSFLNFNDEDFIKSSIEIYENY